jgi:hypothetical protein
MCDVLAAAERLAGEATASSRDRAAVLGEGVALAVDVDGQDSVGERTRDAWVARPK